MSTQLKIVPLRDQLFTPFERTFNQFFNEFFKDSTEQLNKIKSMGYYPKLDVLEENNELIIKVAVAGIPKENLDVTITNNLVTISGKSVEEKENTKYHIKELSSKSFSRSVSIPEWADSTNVEAIIQDGMLKLKWKIPPVPEPNAPKKITIN
jgi:HSP20 family protein